MWTGSNTGVLGFKRVLADIPLYDTPLIGATKGVFEFVYSPFAALVFTPLVPLSGLWFTVVGTLGNFVVLTGVAWLAFGCLGYRRDARLVVFSVLLPKDSATFWGGTFLDATRTGGPEQPENETLRGLIARAIGTGAAQDLLWLVLAGVVVVTGLAAARWLSYSGRELPAVLVCGMVSTTVSPVSWQHHWVWLGLLLIYLLHLSIQPRAIVDRLGLVAACLATSGGVYSLFVPDVPTLLALPAESDLAFLYRNAYVWTAGLLLVVILFRIRKENARLLPEPRTLVNR